MWVTSSLTNVITPTFVALGNFDGVHRGHRKVLQQILGNDHISQDLNVTPQGKTILPSSGNAACGFSSESKIISSNYLIGKAKEKLQKTNQGKPAASPYPTVVTFNPHPQEFFSGQQKSLLTPPEEKANQLRSLGIKQMVLLPFDRYMAELTPQEFVAEILVKKIQAKRISVGEDFRFGRHRTGTVLDLKLIAASYGIDVNITGLQKNDTERISSSKIRQALHDGDIEQVNLLLGRPYILQGTVIKGQQLGRTIGFPTANLQLPVNKFLPGFGVYAVWVNFPANLKAEPILGVMNIGYRPTVGGIFSSVEIHLLDWSGDLYGQNLTVTLAKFLRSEQKFPSLNELKAQIQTDCTIARKILIDV